MRLIRKGAEANLYLGRWYGRAVILKERIGKSYRNSLLDARLRRERTIHEAQMIHQAKRAGVATPTVYFMDLEKCQLYLEYLPGPRLKEELNKLGSEQSRSICHEIGKTIGCLHCSEIVHGDLTTSNMIMQGDSSICLIDFGLSFRSLDIEDRGVDLHLMRRALNSTHFKKAKYCFNSVVDGYCSRVGKELGKSVLGRVRQIERRGRYFEER